MAAQTPPQVICTPYIGRTIKGWSVRVRICVSVSGTEEAGGTLGTDIYSNSAAVLPLINALSDAVFQVPSQTGLYAIAYGGAGATDNAEDVAVFSFLTASGKVGKISIPAPKTAIFLTDQQTVNPAQTDVAAFTSAMTGPAIELGTSTYGISTGSPYTVFLGGLRRRGPTRRRVNIFVRTPALTAGEPAI